MQLAALCGVDAVIPGQGFHADLRRHGVDGEAAGRRAGVARAVSHRHAQGVGPLRQRLQHGGRQGNTPVALRVHRPGVGNPRNHHADGLACPLHPGAAAQGLLAAGLRRVEQGIAKRRIDAEVELRGHGTVQRVLSRDGVAIDIRGSGGHGQVTVGQRHQVGRRHIHRPATVAIGRGQILFAVEGHRDAAACGNKAAEAVNRHRQQRLIVAQHIVIADHPDGDGAEGVINGEAPVGAGRVTGNVADADGVAVGAVGEVSQRRRWNQHAPAAVGVHQPGVLVAVKRHGHHLPGLYVAGAAGH